MLFRSKRMDGLVPSFAERRQGDYAPTKSCQPRSDGQWGDKPGNSTWQPDRKYVPPNPNNNRDGKNWGQILDENNIDGIEFKNGEPDFSEVAVDTVEIDDFSDKRNSNFTQADEKLAEKWSQEQRDGKDWTPADVRQYRKDNGLTWHERSDMKTMDLVPREVHGNISHDGGISVAKKNNGMETKDDE